MEDLNDLDSEIMRLKMELHSPAFARPLAAQSSESDYWKNRLNEERRLLDAKAKEQAAEKKLLEEKIQQQQLNIAHYEQALKEMELKLQNDTHHLEDRLRLRESELLVEQNRILNEEKVKIAELEKNQIKDKMSGLIEKIVSLKEESAAALAAQAEEKEKLRQEVESLLGMITTLKMDVGDAQLAVKQKENEIAALSSKYDALTREIAERTAALEEQKTITAADLAALKKKNEEALAQTRSMIYEMGRHFVKRFNRAFLPLAGLAGYAAGRPGASAAEAVVSDLAVKLEEEVRAYGITIDAPAVEEEPYTALVLGSDEDNTVIAQALEKTAAKVYALTPKDYLREIVDQQPRLVVLSGAYMRKAPRLAAKWPFLPLVLFGAADQRLRKKLSAAAVQWIGPRAALKDITHAIEEVAGHSIARPEYWDQLSERRPAPWGAIAIAGILLAAGTAFGGWWGYKHYIAVPPVLHTPYASPTNMAFDGKNLWVCDWYGQSIYRQDVRGEMQKALSFPNKHFTAIAWAKGYLWSCDSWEKKIFKHRPDDSLTIVASYPAPGSSPSGIAWDGENLWTCDTAAGQIYKHRLDAYLSVTGSYPSPGMNPSGLYFDGKSLWSIDGKTSKLYRHAVEDDLNVSAVFTLPVAESEKITGITGDGENLWLCSEKSGRIFYRPIKQLKTS